MKSTIATIAILALLGMGVGMSVGASPEASVSATVTAELITITVDDGSVDYGILPTSATKNTTAGTNGGADGTQIVTNNSNVAVDLSAKSSNAVGGAAWNLEDVVDADVYAHRFCITNCDTAPVWVTFNADSTTYVSMAAGLSASGGTQDFDLEIKTPSSVSDNILKTITVTILAALAI